MQHPIVELEAKDGSGFRDCSRFAKAIKPSQN
jgi:hypothetical protein